jgi:FemAB-related protein (PEP-CTERM system-associated)
MTTAAPPIVAGAACVIVHRGRDAEACPDEWLELRRRTGAASPSLRHEWLTILREGLGHEPFCIELRDGSTTRGLLPLAFLKTRLFGKFLVGMPYLNVGGVIAEDDADAARLIDAAVQLADQLDVRYLELRHERRRPHAALNYESTQKVHMRLELPGDQDDLWRRFKPKVRNQIRKAEQHGLDVAWGGAELLDEFYRVFAVNMRDLGTPVFSRKLFASMLERLRGDAELCIVRQGAQACAAGLLLHGAGVSEIPSASSLRKFNHLNANMLMYWNLLCRSIARGQRVFDFGRSSADSNTYKFKAQWGAQPHPAAWQYYVRQGSVGDMRPDNPKLQRRIALWRRLPVWLTRLAGPPIVRGIP